MEKLGEIISRLMMQEGYQQRSRQGPIFERWLEVVGDLLAQKSRPLLIRKGVLVVQVTDSVWMHELQMQKGVILDKIRELVGEGEVVDVRWTIWGDTPVRLVGKGLTLACLVLSLALIVLPPVVQRRTREDPRLSHTDGAG